MTIYSSGAHPVRVLMARHIQEKEAGTAAAASTLPETDVSAICSVCVLQHKRNTNYRILFICRLHIVINQNCILLMQS